MVALEKYRSAKGAYPILPAKEVLVSELAGTLVAGGHIRAIPASPSGAEPIHYASFDGNSFGLSIKFVTTGPCKIVIGAPGAGWWGSQPPCQLQ